MSDLSARTASLERRSRQQEGDIQHIYDELASHTKILRDHSRVLGEHSRVLGEHSRILGEHTRILGDQSRILDEHTQTLDEQSRRLRWLRSGVTSVLLHFGVDPPADEDE